MAWAQARVVLQLCGADLVGWTPWDETVVDWAELAKICAGGDARVIG